jgi:hypothetical protein
MAVVLAIGGCAASCVAGETPEMVTRCEQELEQARQNDGRLRAQAAGAPEELKDIWSRRLGISASVLDLRRRALDAVKAGNEGGAGELRRQAGSQERRGYSLEQWMQAELRVIEMRRTPAGGDDREKACQERILGLYEEVCKRYREAAGGDGEAQEADRYSYRCAQQAQMLQQVLQGMKERREAVQERGRVGNAEIRAMLDRRIALLDGLIAVQEEAASVLAAEGQTIPQELLERQRRLQQELRNWHERRRTAEEQIELDKELAGAPGELRPLLLEIKGCHTEIARSRAGMEKLTEGSLEKARAGGRIEALEAKVEGLGRVLNLRRETAKSLAEIKEEFRQAPRVKALLAEVAGRLDAYEKTVRRGAELAAAVAGLEAEMEAIEEEADGIGDDADDLVDRIGDEVDKLEEQAKRGADPVAGDRVPDLVKRLKEAMGAFDVEYAGLEQQAPAHAARVRGVLEQALERAGRAAELVKAGQPDAARAEVLAAENAVRLVEDRLAGTLRVCQGVATRLAALPAEKRAAAEKAAAVCREAAEQAARTAIAAEQALGPEAEAGKIVLAIREAAEAEAAMRQAVAVFERLVAPAPARRGPGNSGGRLPVPGEPDIF